MEDKKNRIKDIFNKNNLCISNNPKGLTKSWPKSYVKKFYDKNIHFSKNNKKRIRLLDFDCNNTYQSILWGKIFENLILVNKKLIFDDFDSLKINNSFDIIIVNKINKIKTSNDFRKILNLLEINGILIIEDSGNSLLFILKIFFIFSLEYNIIIEDYRLDNFLRNNCLFIIKKYKRNNIVNFFQFISNLLKILYYTLMEISILFIDKIKP